MSEHFELAKRHAPILYFDKLEPFLPLAVGYTVFTASQASPSFKRQIDLPENCTTAIEYAIWWDWDIQHLYELEHLWIYLDQSGHLLDAEGSFHGDFHKLRGANDALITEESRLVAFSEPGKHAFAGHLEQLENLVPLSTLSCGENAGSGDVLINHMFAGNIQATTLQKRLCKRYMKSHAFTPSYDFSRRFDLGSIPIIPWTRLKAFIPKRVNSWLEHLSTELPHVKAVFLDCGDTLVDEATELKDEAGYVLSAELIPGAMTLLEGLEGAGYRVALVADGLVDSFTTIFDQHGFHPFFAVKTISETIGADKPDPRMFQDALTQLELSTDQVDSVVMVGNNLSRDIKGANDFGLWSVWLDWAPRRSKVPADETEIPDYTIKEPLELLSVLEHIELGLIRDSLAQLGEPLRDPQLV
ncbi:MAG: HAD-IA family hydrolase [Trueperaceae bacterium]|nr:HAD-IA family hydrolase [Trueperaceae bacterium]